MKRVPIFVLLGPTMVVLIVLSREVIARGAVPGGYVEGCAMLFFFSLIICAVTVPVDGVLAYVLPICLRAPLTAIVGAAVAVGLRLYMSTQVGNKVPPSLYPEIPMEFIWAAVIGGLTTGACSLLSHNYRNEKTRPGDPVPCHEPFDAGR
jgi:hypothetical protein